MNKYILAFGDFFHYRRGKVPGPGAERYALSVPLQFAAIGLFGGDNGAVQKQLMITQHPPLYSGFANTVAGLGGLQAGMLYGAPLSPNPNPGQNSGAI